MKYKKIILLILTIILFSYTVNGIDTSMFLQAFNFDYTSADNDTVYDFTGKWNATKDFATSGTVNKTTQGCKIRSCYNFTSTGHNTGGYLNISSPINENYTELTIMMWYNAVPRSSDNAGLFGVEGTKKFDAKSVLRDASNTVFYVSNGTGARRIYRADTDYLNFYKADQFIALVYNFTTGNGKIYRNDTLYASFKGNTSWNTSNPQRSLALGGHSNPSGEITDSFHGLIDEFGLFKTALSKNQVREYFRRIHNDSREITDTNFSMYWGGAEPQDNYTTITANYKLNFSIFFSNNNVICNLSNKTGTVYVYKNISTGDQYILGSAVPNGYQDINLTCSDGTNWYSEGKNLNSTGYSATYSYYNVTILDQNTKNYINQINFTIEFVGSSYQDSTTTTNSSHVFNVVYETANDDSGTLRAFSTLHNDYSIVINEFDIDRTNFTNNKTFLLYMTNTSDIETTNLVTFHVQDENGNPLENALLIVQKQDPDTNSFITITELRTNPNGETTTILETETVFYKFIVEYNDVRIFSSPSPVTISLNDDDIYIRGTVGGRFTGYLDSLLDTDIYMGFNKLTNNSGYFTLSFVGTDEVETCMRINLKNSTGYNFIESKCLNGTSGDLQSSTFTVTNRTLYVAIAELDAKDGEGFRFVGIYERYIGQLSETIDKVKGTVIILALISLCAFGFYKFPVVGLIVFAIGSLIISFTGLIPAFTRVISMIIVSFCVVSIFIISRFKNT